MPDVSKPCLSRISRGVIRKTSSAAIDKDEVPGGESNPAGGTRSETGDRYRVSFSCFFDGALAAKNSRFIPGANIILIQSRKQIPHRAKMSCHPYESLVLLSRFV